MQASLFITLTAIDITLYAFLNTSIGNCDLSKVLNHRYLPSFLALHWSVVDLDVAVLSKESCNINPFLFPLFIICCTKFPESALILNCVLLTLDFTSPYSRIQLLDLLLKLNNSLPIR